MQRQSIAAQEFMALGAPEQKREAATAFIADQRAQIKPVRARAAPRQLEGPVVAAISELLAVHPRVLIALRMNSGAASYEAASGKYAPVWFHRWLRYPYKMRMPDFFGFVNHHHDFNYPIPLAIEAKAPGWTKPTDDREREQEKFLAFIEGCNGISLFATDVSQVAAALK